MFIASLIADIIRGMIYLHESPLKYHGSLCTSNCLIDSRWVVKLSDFGLHAFKKGVEDTPDAQTMASKCLSEFTLHSRINVTLSNDFISFNFFFCISKNCCIGHQNYCVRVQQIWCQAHQKVMFIHLASFCTKCTRVTAHSAKMALRQWNVYERCCNQMILPCHFGKCNYL